MTLITPHKKVVLIVEDDPLLRMVAMDVVEEAGFVGVEASGADEAINILADRDDVSVLFTDVDMPGQMNGIGLAKWAIDAFRSIKVIVTSGHYDMRRAEEVQEWVFFPKPYDIDMVTEEIKRLAWPN